MKPIGVLLLAACGLAHAQTAPQLAPPKPVDMRVKTVRWHPGGDALLYTREEETGIGVGVYRLQDSEGKVVLHLGKDDKYQTRWFAGTLFALVTVYRTVHAGWGDGREGAVYLIDVKRKTSTEVFSRTVHPDEPIQIDAHLSPSLTHAIFDIQEGKKNYHSVLTVSGGELVASPDIDEATKQGMGGPSWSKNGTAIYSKGSGIAASFASGDGTPIEFNLANLVVDTGDAVATDGDQAVNLVFTTSLDTETAATSSELTAVLDRTLARTFELALASPAAGTPVMEVVPSNGVLRQVQSPGPWESPPGPAPVLGTQSHKVSISFGDSKGEANSVWLTAADPKNPGGLLVAPHADRVFLGPTEIAIAYETDGALFVRRILRG